MKALFGAGTADARADHAARFAAFEQAYEAYKLQVRRTAFNLVGLRDLDDVVQESFVRLWKSWDDFEGRSDRRTWVYRITVNTCREHWRKHGRYQAAVARYALEPRPQSATGGQEEGQLSRRIAEALGALSLEHRETVALCYLEGLSLAEAAEGLGLAEGTVKSRLHHARKQMAAFLGQGD